ncbi:MAG: NADH-quinone oxidoreductase subunit C [Thaumarchaeota archaeon]|nr:NADH-quinone oxidoreductase subunit C [Nitrososphaerota archaeon]
MSSETTIDEKSSETVETKPEVAKKEAVAVEPKFEKSLAEKITSKFGTKTTIGFIKPNRIRINAKKEDILDVATFIRDELNFDHAESVTGVDYPKSKEIEVVYHLGSYTDQQLAKQILALVTRVPREDVPNPGNDSTRMPSLRDIFYSVEFHERECFEMLGVYFEGHPDNRKLLLPEDWADIPPFRKDFSIKGR